jgi:multidrug efflux pump subunit AcrA (membrane-fusion protein)
VGRIIGVLLTLLLASCAGAGSETVSAANPGEIGDAARIDREVRLTGVLEAVHSVSIGVPQIIGQGGQLTLTRLVPNGSRVEQGDFIAGFDATSQLDAGIAAQAKYDDLGHQVEQKVAQNRADAEKRRADLTQAQADLDKALLEVQKAPILSEIAQQQNEIRVDMGRQHVESLKKSNAAHDAADAAALRILELQRDRQKVAMERAETNLNRMRVLAPLAGMVAHQTVFRGDSMGRPQEGDQLWRGQALVSIFDPAEMLVRCAVGEPDNAVLKPGARATVYLDAYPDLALPARFESASPIAASALGSPVKTFTAVFRLETRDPRLMPDLSAAVVILAPVAGER